MRHFRERYGDDEVKTWYFEVWNEPDIAPFWSADLEEYLKLYKRGGGSREERLPVVSRGRPGFGGTLSF